MENNDLNKDLYEAAEKATKHKAREVSSLRRRPNVDDLSDMFIAGADWQKQKSIEAFRVMGERTRFDIPTDVLIKARGIFIEELNK